jgi:hypothetical protein
MDGYDQAMGSTVVKIGLVVIVVGLIIMLAERFNIRLGRLPGDIAYQGKNGSFYFPIVTCILASVVLTLVMWLFGKR